MRKPRRLSREELAPYTVDLPAANPGSAAVPAATASHGEKRSELGNKLPVCESRAAETAALPGVLDWPALFGNDRPVEVEVGFGKGLFLVNAGESRPDRNFFGVEVVRKYQLYAATRVAVRKLPNVKTCCADAKAVLRDLIPPGSVSAVHVYFPDPWWKQRHKKRLLFTPDFAASVLRVLVPGGRLHFVSDVPDYFEMVTTTLAGLPAFRRLSPPDATEPTHDMDYLTNFERKFRKQGKPIHRALYEKIPGG